MEYIQEARPDHVEPSPSYHLSANETQDLRALWDKEYGRNSTIPSSRRFVPAHALVQLAKNIDLTAQTALDLGCGNGRNAFYLAALGINVTALDFSQTALALLDAEKKKSECAGTVSLLNHDIRDGLPLASGSMDLVLDSYCLCHFVDDDEQQDAMAEVYRVLKPGGRLIKIHLDINDAYYLERVNSRTSYGHTSYDSANGLFKRHMSLDSYLRTVCRGFDFIKSEQINFSDDVRGTSYERTIFVCITQKPLA